MLFVGYSIWLVSLICGFAMAEYMFFQISGRTFWRVLIPPEIRLSMYPDDPISLDSFMVLEEWVAILFYASCMTLPTIALNFMGLINLFK
ncbi:MAG: hypothetical protein HQM08_13145 [Candidatus Riflebacteria bacterium]|nr:hypothetical protein [Candidatus Riflebacteria bacterium]